MNKNIGFLCIRVYSFMLYYSLLNEMFEHLLLNTMYCNHYFNVSYRLHHIMSLKLDFEGEASEIKESVSVYCLLVSCSKYVVNFSKLHV